VGVAVVVLGFAATLVVGTLMARPPPAATGDTESVLVAARDVPARTVLAAADVSISRYAPSDVPPAALTSAAPALGLVVQSPLRKGQPVLSNQIAKAGDATGGQPAYLPLPTGFVALTLPSAELQGVGGYVQSGDYIDIQAIVTPKGSQTANIRTIYGDVRVIRVGPAVDAAPGTTQRTGGITTSLTVAVTECQSEYLNWFISNAVLKYTLLSYQDYQPPGTNTDASCPRVGSAKGVVEADIRSRWPGLD